MCSVFSQEQYINLKFNRNLFYDVGRECSLEGKFEVVINRTHPAYLLKLDGKDKTVFSHQTFDCVIKVRTEWYTNRSRNPWNRDRWNQPSWEQRQWEQRQQEKNDDNNDLSGTCLSFNPDSYCCTSYDV